MSNKSLIELYAGHTGKVSDKWSLYLSEYDRLLAEYRSKPVRLLEIGIQNGGSLEIWSSYFSQAIALIGCDINPDCAVLRYDDPRIAVIVGDANAPDVGAQVLQRSPQFDIVIDDGSHRSSDIIKSFALYFPHIADGGVFIAEDLHCSYWSEFEGGLFDPYSAITFFKRLADVINHEHWGVARAPSVVLRGIFARYGCAVDAQVLLQVHSVEFINSICVVRKKAAGANVLGQRVIAGSQELVVPSLRISTLAPNPVRDQSGNPWATRRKPPDEDILRAEQALANAEQQIAMLNLEVGHRDQQVASLYNSLSWRVTAPLRLILQPVMRVYRRAAFTLTTISRLGGLKATASEAFSLLRAEGLAGVWRGIGVATIPKPIVPAPGSDAFDRNDYAEWTRRYDTLTETLRATLRLRAAGLAWQPLISVLMPVFNPKPEWLTQAIESVRNQLYPQWELCIADDASTDPLIRPILERYAREDARIKVTFRAQNGHISAASNTALQLAAGSWIALLDHDDLLSEHALFWLADTINQHPDCGIVYSDEDKIDKSGNRFDPYFKCDWNVDLFLSQNLISHLGAYKVQLVNELGGFSLGMEGSQDYDLALRCIEHLTPQQIQHVPKVLYHWRVHVGSTARSNKAKPYAALAGEKALREHFERLQVSATAEFIGYGYRVRYALPSVLPLVSLIMPTRNALKLLRQCIASILGKTSYPHYELLIVDNGSDDPPTLEYLDSLKIDPRVRVVRDDRPFNYSALNNAAVKLARGDLLALVNNDLEVISPDWLSEMVSIALQPGTGAVGARLWYPHNTLQHAGVIMGLGGVAGHSYQDFPQHLRGHGGRTVLIQGFSAVTAACMVIRKSIYEEVGGLNEADLAVAFNDIDFCLRVREAGYRNVWTPYAELYHHESASRGIDDTPEKQMRFAKEVQYMRQHWGDHLLTDPAYSPNLTLVYPDFSLAWPPRAPDQTQCAGASARRSTATPAPSNRVEKTLHLIDRQGLGLEIGPSHNPMAPKKSGFNVHILDHATAAELRVKYADHPVNLNNIEEVDFVWRGEPLSELIGQNHCYDWIVASHVIEHVTDLAGFLQQCEKLLTAGGVLSLVVPDKRYCFDYYRWPSSTGDALQAFTEQRVRHSPGTIFDHSANVSKMNEKITWTENDRGDIQPMHTLDEAAGAWKLALQNEEYIDCHGWTFTPSSFRIILHDLQKLGLTDLVEVGSFDTEGFEFWITLGKGQENPVVYDRTALCKAMIREMEMAASCIS